MQTIWDVRSPLKIIASSSSAAAASRLENSPGLTTRFDQSSALTFPSDGRYVSARRESAKMLDEAIVKSIFGSIVAQLQDSESAGGEFISAKSFYNAGLAAGLDMTAGDSERRGPTLKAMIKSFASVSLLEKGRALTSMVKSLVASGKENTRIAASILNQFGVAWDGNNIVAAGVMDERERVFLPANSAADLAKAVDRLAGGDESGAISAACGAVDHATGLAYEKLGLGDPGKVSFSAKVNTALQQMKVFDLMKDEFIQIGIDVNEAEHAVGHLASAINQSTQALQILRKRMGDVHGTRPALRSTAYDCIKFASAICALFEK
jgi:hypothetical protein